MANFRYGDMWDVFGNTGLFMITTNPVVRKDGAGVMGRGIAKQAAERFPELPFALGRSQDPAVTGYQGICNTGTLGRYDGQLMGFFMVKDHWREPAKLSIIEDSVYDLLIWAHNFDRIDLNFPGIGNGKLSREAVLPLVEKLPDHVNIWEYTNG